LLLNKYKRVKRKEANKSSKRLRNEEEREQNKVKQTPLALWVMNIFAFAFAIFFFHSSIQKYSTMLCEACTQFEGNFSCSFFNGGDSIFMNIFSSLSSRDM